MKVFSAHLANCSAKVKDEVWTEVVVMQREERE